MKRNKSLLLFVLLLTMVLVLTACGSNDKSDSADSDSDTGSIEEVKMSEADRATLIESLIPPVGGVFEAVEHETLDGDTHINVWSHEQVIKEVSAWYAEKLASLDFIDKIALDKAEEEKRNKEKLEKNPNVQSAPEPEGEPGMDSNGEPLVVDEFKGYIQGQLIRIDLTQNTGVHLGDNVAHPGQKDVVIWISFD